MTLHHVAFPSPLGMLDVFSSPKGVASIEPAECQTWVATHLDKHFAGEKATKPTSGDPWGATEKLARYFGGELDALDELTLDLQGTPFQLAVWAALRTIPVGTTTSYGVLARKLGRPQASRAVGMANARNPVMIVVPCHRVIGTSGALTGYAGGLERKAWLLRHERAQAQLAIPSHATP
jgi:methylated-DNA-[protein]-cysteine S-methyltransferase